MNKLWVRLTLAFALVVTVGIIAAAFLANRQVNTQFRHFVAQNQLSVPDITQGLTTYYARQGDWEGVQNFVANSNLFGGGKGQGQGQSRGQQRGQPQLVLTDAQGNIIYSADEMDAVSPLSSQDLTNANPLYLQETLIGYWLVVSHNEVQLSVRDQAFLQQINAALLQAGVFAIFLAIVLGLFIARSISAPLSKLVEGTHQVIQGNLSGQVQTSGLDVDEVVDLAETFNQMIAHLEHAETLRRNMVADIAHELRTPLSVIQGNLQAIIDGVYPLETAEIKDIHEETVMLHRLIEDLHQLSQAEAGQLKLVFEPSDLIGLLENSAGLFGSMGENGHIDLVLDLPAELPLLAIDSDRIRQVLHNLLGNALRHTPSGGKVILKAVPQPNQVHISVCDTGPGLSTEAQKQVFNRFWRTDSARDRERGGAGLGLAIARQLVLAHGGEIGVTSQPGQGSCFWFTLPQA